MEKPLKHKKDHLRKCYFRFKNRRQKEISFVLEKNFLKIARRNFKDFSLARITYLPV